MTDLRAAIRQRMEWPCDAPELAALASELAEAVEAVVDLHGNYDTDPCLKLDDAAWWNPALFEDCPTIRTIAEKLGIQAPR